MAKVKISTMTGKLRGLSAINSSPLDNPFCQSMAKDPENICSKCYSCSMLRGLRKNCRPAWRNTGEQLSTAPLPDNDIPIIKTDLCRFSAHGDLFNKTHADNFFKIARANPKTTFALWTKRPELVAVDSCPDNVILVYSSPKINSNSTLPRGFDKVFTVWNAEGIELNDVDINCGAKSCLTCQLCYSKTNGVVFVNEKIK